MQCCVCFKFVLYEIQTYFGGVHLEDVWLCTDISGMKQEDSIV